MRINVGFIEYLDGRTEVSPTYQSRLRENLLAVPRGWIRILAAIGTASYVTELTSRSVSSGWDIFVTGFSVAIRLGPTAHRKFGPQYCL